MDDTRPKTETRRQPARDSRNTVLLTARVQPAVRSALEAIARANGWTLSAAVDEAVQRAYGVGNFRERKALDGRSRWAGRASGVSF